MTFSAKEKRACPSEGMCPCCSAHEALALFWEDCSHSVHVVNVIAGNENA